MNQAMESSSSHHFFGKTTLVKYGQELHLSRICIAISFNY